jgi:hypothetical protein
MRTLTSPDIAQLRELCSAHEFFWLDLEDPDARGEARSGAAADRA